MKTQDKWTLCRAAIKALPAVWCIAALIGCASQGSIYQSLNYRKALAAPADSASKLRVVLGPELTAHLRFLYRYIQETEFAVCLEGRIKGQQIEVDNFRMAKMHATAPNGVKYEPCNIPGYVGMAHNHLPRAADAPSPCYFSASDIRSFDSDKAALIDVVICGEDQFVFKAKPL